jgi:hypothetical protein
MSALKALCRDVAKHAARVDRNGNSIQVIRKDLDQVDRTLRRIEARSLRHLEFMAATYPMIPEYRQRLDEARRRAPSSTPAERRALGEWLLQSIKRPARTTGKAARGRKGKS